MTIGRIGGISNINNSKGLMKNISISMLKSEMNLQEQSVNKILEPIKEENKGNHIDIRI